MSLWLQLYRVFFNRNIFNPRFITLANALGFTVYCREVSLLKRFASSYAGARADTE